MKAVQTLSAGPYTLRLYPPDGTPEGIVYLPMHGSADDIAALLPGRRAAIAVIDGFSWNRDLSPWPAEAVFGSEPFGGQADRFLSEMTGMLIPTAEEALGVAPGWRGIAGYSLAGLFAVYAAYRTDAFTRIASVSGSMWYDGWLEYARQHPFASRVERAYFSVGVKEKKTRNPRMQPVEENTRAMHALYIERGADCRFVLNPGNHFVDADKRLQDALDFLCL